MIVDFINFHNLNESVKLTDDEKEYLWSKVEYRKKQRSISTENELFNLLNGDKDSFNNDEFNTILNSLEYTFRKKLKGLDNPIKNDIFLKIKDKIPEDWFGIKYSSIESKKRRDEKDNK
jgi:hypothetical protein